MQKKENSSQHAQIVKVHTYHTMFVHHADSIKGAHIRTPAKRFNTPVVNIILSVYTYIISVDINFWVDSYERDITDSRDERNTSG